LAKTQAMKFRRGGRVAASDTLFLSGVGLDYVNRFPYLGIVIPFNTRSFGDHVKERFKNSLLAMTEIKKPWLLSTDTALRLFDCYVASVASYGIQTVWPYLSLEDLKAMERIKATFLKRMLSLHISTKNRYTYLLVGTPLFLEELVRRFNLPHTLEYQSTLQIQEEKFGDIEADFYAVPAMHENGWKGIERPNRHLVTRFAVHGFHHCLCTNQAYHEPTEECRCKLCGQRCERYHASKCANALPLHQLANLR